MKMIDHNHFICHLILGTFTEYPKNKCRHVSIKHADICFNLWADFPPIAAGLFPSVR